MLNNIKKKILELYPSLEDKDLTISEVNETYIILINNEKLKQLLPTLKENFTLTTPEIIRTPNLNVSTITIDKNEITFTIDHSILKFG